MSNLDGKVETKSTAEESYDEKDSHGLNRHGKGRIDLHNGDQIFESTSACDGGICDTKTDRTKRPIRGYH